MKNPEEERRKIPSLSAYETINFINDFKYK